MTAPGTLDRPLAPVSLRALKDVDPFPAYAAIAAAGPVLWDEGMNAWLVSPHELCTMVLRREDLYAEPTGSLPGAAQIVGRRDIRSLLGEQHETLHRAVSHAWRPDPIAPLAAGAVRPLVAERLAGLASRPTFELFGEFARLLPISVISRVLGLPDADTATLDMAKTWMEAVLAWRHSYGEDPELVEAAIDHAVDAPAEEEPDVSDIHLRLVLGVHQQQGVARAAHRGLGAQHDVRHQRVGDVREHEPDAERLAAAQALGQEVGLVLQLGDRGEDPVAHGGRHVGVPREHPADRGDRHVREVRHLAHAGAPPSGALSRGDVRGGRPAHTRRAAPILIRHRVLLPHAAIPEAARGTETAVPGTVAANRSTGGKRARRGVPARRWEPGAPQPRSVRDGVPGCVAILGPVPRSRSRAAGPRGCRPARHTWTDERRGPIAADGGGT